MKRIEDIKEFKDIDTYYEISKIVDEVFQDRVEAHKHLVTANKEIERLNKKIEQYENPEDMTLMFMWCDEKAKDEIKRLNNIINKALHKLRASKDHFKTERENNVITFTIRILEGED